MNAAEVEWTAMLRLLADSLLIRYNDIGCSLGAVSGTRGGIQSPTLVVVNRPNNIRRTIIETCRHT